MPNPISKLTDALAGKVEETKPSAPKPAPKAPEAPKSVSYTEYRDKDYDYMKGQVKRINKRLAPKGMPKRSK